MKTGKELFGKKTSVLALAGAISLAALSLTGTASALVLGPVSGASSVTVDPSTWISYDNFSLNGGATPNFVTGYNKTWAPSTPILISPGVTQLQITTLGNEITNPLDPVPNEISADGLNNGTGVPSPGATPASVLASQYPTGFVNGTTPYGIFSLGNPTLPYNAATNDNPGGRMLQPVSFVNNGLDGAVYGVFLDSTYDKDFAALPTSGDGNTNHNASTITGLSFDQPFFIGDGLTGTNWLGSITGTIQTFTLPTLPAGSTGQIYLLLGLMDDPNVADNSDGLTTLVRVPGTNPTPEPGTWLFGVAILGVIGKMGLGMWRCRGLLAR